jgi:glucose/arabinose dehydrogenase
VKLTKIMEEPGTPTFVTSPPNDPSRIFVTYLNGTLRILSSGNVVTAGNFPVAQDFGEQGFFSIAFHPKFDAATEKRVYLFFNETTGHSRIVETTLDGDTLDTSDFETKTIIYQEQPNQNHNGGQLQFGPDGYLYAGFGDGGNQCDEHGAGGFFPIVTMPNNQAINLQSKLGSILRIDVDNIDALPAGNIDAGGGNDGQILHYGLRNPWRFSFDRGTNDLWIADVGQNAYEELNVLPAGSDGSVGPSTNFGWPGKEGTHDSSSSNCSQAPDPDPSAMDPIHDYGRGDGTSITGGYVYRGAAIPEMQGRYIFADYGSKNIWSITWDGTQACDFEDIADAFDGGGVLSGITSFGEDASGELYVAATSGVFKVEPK